LWNVKPTWIELSRSQKQKALPSFSQHHDQFGAVQAAAQQQQAQDVGGLLGSLTETAQSETPAEAEQLEHSTLMSPETMTPSPAGISYFQNPLPDALTSGEKLKRNAGKHQSNEKWIKFWRTKKKKKGEVNQLW